jgi:dipeptidyl aminopeptidase/acylaminoacyl peptidase
VNHLYSIFFPIQLLLANGFAIFQAELPVPNGGPTGDPVDMIAEEVLPCLDVLDRQPEVSAGKIGFYGHSNGGYAALALATKTRRFKAVVAAATFPDPSYTTLVSSPLAKPLACAGYMQQSERWYYEAPTQPYSMRAAPWEDQARYRRNSPLHQLKDSSTPVLLIEGEFDSTPDVMEAAYTTLLGNGVPVELAFYWGEGHVLGSPANIRDAWERIVKWYEMYLV